MLFQNNIIFLGSKPIGYHCLKFLIQNKERLNVNILGVLTQSRIEFGLKQDLKELANANGIKIIEELDDLPECDILYSVQYHKILKQHHIDSAKKIAVNLHMAPLPEYRGCNQFTCAIIDGKKEFGTTIHVMNSKIDNGDILFQKRFPIPDNCWVEDLYNLTFQASVRLFEQTLAHVVQGIYNPIPQQVLENKFGTSLHFRNEIGNLKVIDLDWDKEKIERQLRATYMPGFEAPYCLIDGQKIYFKKGDTANSH